MKRSEQKAKLEELNRQIEELKNVDIEEDGVWRPEYREKYWSIGSDGDISLSNWYNCNVDFKKLPIGNVFKTKEEVEFQIERLKVLAELKQFSCEFKYGLSNYYIEYDYHNENITYMLCYSDVLPSICFESKERFKEAIKSVGEEKIKKYLFCIK